MRKKTEYRNGWGKKQAYNYVINAKGRIMGEKEKEWGKRMEELRCHRKKEIENEFR